MIPVLQKLNELAQYGLMGVERDDIVFIAKSVWYYDLMPDLGRIIGPFRNDVGYLTDVLARFSVLSKERRVELIASLEPFRPALPATNSNCEDPRAMAWNASCDIKPFMGDILPFQTRHYAAGWGR